MNEPTLSNRARAAVYLLSAAAVVVVMWGWFFLEQFTDWRLTKVGSSAKQDPIHVAFPLIVSVLAPVLAFVFWKRAAGIAANGVPVTATVTAVGRPVNSMRNVSFDYTFEGADYSKKMSLDESVAGDLSVGDELPVIVDKRNPKRVLVE